MPSSNSVCGWSLYFGVPALVGVTAISSVPTVANIPSSTATFFILRKSGQSVTDSPSNCCRDPKECVPPVRPKSAGYVFYAGCLAFIIPAIILSTLYVAIAVRQFIHHKICTA